jgi:hypothetical protein
VKTAHRSYFGFAATAFASVTLAALLAAGCSLGKKKTPPETAFRVGTTSGKTNLVISTANSHVGRVTSVNPQARFAVLSFPIGQLPANDTRLSLFRGDKKVGEIKITGPAQENFTVGDIITGAAREGDEVRGE